MTLKPPFLFLILNHYLIKKKNYKPMWLIPVTQRKNTGIEFVEMKKKIVWPSRWISQTAENSWAPKSKVWSEKQEEHVPRGVVHMLRSTLNLGAEGIQVAMQVHGSCFPTWLGDNWVGSGGGLLEWSPISAGTLITVLFMSCLQWIWS